jgi:hypothetical protein
MLEPDLNRRVFAFEILVNTWSTFAEAPIEGRMGECFHFPDQWKSRLGNSFRACSRGWRAVGLLLPPVGRLVSSARPSLGSIITGRPRVASRGDTSSTLSAIRWVNRAVALDPAGDADEPPGDHRLAEGLVDLLPDHDIGDAGLVLQREEDDARGRAGALAGDDKAGDGDAALGLWQAIMGRLSAGAGARVPSDGRGARGGATGNPRSPPGPGSSGAA